MAPTVPPVSILNIRICSISRRTPPTTSDPKTEVDSFCIAPYCVQIDFIVPGPVRKIVWVAGIANQMGG